MRKGIRLLPWRWFRSSNVQEGNIRSDTMGEIVSKDLRRALNDPKTRYRIVDAVLARTAKEVQGAPTKAGATYSLKDPAKKGGKSNKK